MRSKGHKTRKKIIEESLKLFIAKGYYATSIEDILAATKLSKGGLYCYFRSKEDLWDATYEEASRIWRRVVFKDLRGISDPIDRLKKLVNNILENYLENQVFHGGAYFVPMLVEVSGRSEKMSNKLIHGFEAFIQLLHRWLKEADQKDILKQDLNLEEISYFIMTIFNGATTLYITTGDVTILKRTLTQLNVFLDNLKAG